jgi:hypothetical protein
MSDGYEYDLEYYHECEHEILSRIDWDPRRAKMERARTLSREELLEAYRRETERSAIYAFMFEAAVARLVDLKQILPGSAEEFFEEWGGLSPSWFLQHLGKSLSLRDAHKSLRKGLGYKKTRTPDLGTDRRILEWLAANPRRSWAQADREFGYAEPYGKKCFARIERNKEDYDPELTALYQKVKSQRERGPKKKSPPY